MYFCFIQLCSLISRNFHYDQMQIYRKSNLFRCVLLELHFVIDATVKHLISRSFLKCGVSAETMAAHKHFCIKLNQIFIILVSLHSLQYQNAVTSGGALPCGLKRLGNAATKKRCSGGELVAIVRPIRPAWELNLKSSALIATSLTLRYNRPVRGKIIKI